MELCKLTSAYLGRKLVRCALAALLLAAVASFFTSSAHVRLASRTIVDIVIEEKLKQWNESLVEYMESPEAQTASLMSSATLYKAVAAAARSFTAAILALFALVFAIVDCAIRKRFVKDEPLKFVLAIIFATSVAVEMGLMFYFAPASADSLTKSAQALIKDKLNYFNETLHSPAYLQNSTVSTAPGTITTQSVFDLVVAEWFTKAISLINAIYAVLNLVL
jgi:hypothetical protein